VSKSVYEIIRHNLVTEKGTYLQKYNKYLFITDRRANKIEIRKAVEKIFNVKVKSVHVLNVKPKPKRMRWRLGHTPREKKAIVTLKEGYSIEVK